MARRVNHYYPQAEVIATEIFDTDGLEVLDVDNQTVNADLIHIDTTDPDNHTDILVVDVSAGSGIFPGGIEGDIEGDVTGNITGNITGSLLDPEGGIVINNALPTATITGNLVGDVTSTGTSTFGDITVNGDSTFKMDTLFEGDTTFAAGSSVVFNVGSSISFENVDVTNLTPQTDVANQSYDPDDTEDDAEPETLKFWTGSDDEYNAITEKDPGTLYFVHEIIDEP